MQDKGGLPKVSLVIPCRNEARGITRLLNSLIKQDYPQDLVEIIVVDGLSEDGTAEVARKCAAQHPERRIEILSNPWRVTPVGLNIGIERATGEIIFTLGAHARYPDDYIRKIVDTLINTGADAVGSIALTLPSSSTPVAHTIARVLSSPFGVGNSLMRIIRGNPAAARLYFSADTASCPGYRRELFAQLGTFNPRLIRNHDIEFHQRLRRAGKKLILTTATKTYYYARSSLGELFRNAFGNGYWVVRSIRLVPSCRFPPFAFRHTVPGLFVLTLFLSGVLALLSNVLPAHLPFGRTVFRTVFTVTTVSYSTALVFFSIVTLFFSRNVPPAHLPFGRAGRSGLHYLPLYLLTFSTLHLGYGLGSLWGLFTLWRPDPAESGSPPSPLCPKAGVPEAHFLQKNNGCAMEH